MGGNLQLVLSDAQEHVVRQCVALRNLTLHECTQAAKSVCEDYSSAPAPAGGLGRTECMRACQTACVKTERHAACSDPTIDRANPRVCHDRRG